MNISWICIFNLRIGFFFLIGKISTELPGISILNIITCNFWPYPSKSQKCKIDIYLNLEKKIGVKLPKIFILNICNTDGHKWQNSINFSSSGCRFDI